MERNEIENLARQLLDGQIDPAAFADQLSRKEVAELGDANLDLDRERRCGFPEVIYGEGKSTSSLLRICEALLEQRTPVLATRIDEEMAMFLLSRFPQGDYNSLGRTFRVDVPGESPRAQHGRVTLITAGTSDMPVAEEAHETLRWMGIEVQMVCDVGVAGPHRLQRHLEKFENADAVVVVAGAEGALPSVVGGYAACPVIGVPTSVGYGTHFGGVAALLSMLNSCAANVTVVNIDAGFKGAYIAGLIASRAAIARGE